MNDTSASVADADDRFRLERSACRCLCGAVSYTVRLVRDATVAACHCEMCQRWAGGISLAVECAPDIEIADATEVGVYVSSDWGERGFCKSCGSCLFWRTRDGSMANIPPPALVAPHAFTLATEYCVDRKPGYYALGGDAKRLTEADMYALYSEPESPHA